MDLKDLYRDVIVDHNRRPRNFREIADADRRADGFNPLCGDRLTIGVGVDDCGHATLPLARPRWLASRRNPKSGSSRDYRMTGSGPSLSEGGELMDGR